MRGKEGVALLSGQIVGITPAYAGKRAAANFHLGTTRDHPRVCGEKSTLAMVAVVLAGSPPRMRGKVGDFDTGVSGGGITPPPAYAGKRLSSLVISMNPKDHPRVCGEKSLPGL